MLKGHSVWKSFFWTQFPVVGLKEDCSAKSRNVTRGSCRSVRRPFKTYPYEFESGVKAAIH